MTKCIEKRGENRNLGESCLAARHATIDSRRFRDILCRLSANNVVEEFRVVFEPNPLVGHEEISIEIRD